jgi:hypothetical protein
VFWAVLSREKVTVGTLTLNGGNATKSVYHGRVNVRIAIVVVTRPTLGGNRDHLISGCFDIHLIIIDIYPLQILKGGKGTGHVDGGEA